MRYDLIIVGGGLVGAALAASLHATKLRIAIIDAKWPTNNDPRLFALNHSSCTFLQNLNLWDELRVYANPIHQVHVSRRGQFGAVRLCREDIHLSALGHVIPAYHIETALDVRLQCQEQVTWYRPALLQQLQQQEDGHKLTLLMQGDALELTTPLLVAADGADSSVRQLLQIDTDVVDYAETAIVTRTQLQRSHQHIAYERFNDDGAIAMLPLGDNECATVWTAKNERATALAALSSDDFLQALQREFGYRLGRLLQVGMRHRFPLRMVRARESVRQGALLLGNAAHTLHPIAAQGFNLALYEVALLAAELSNSVPDLKKWQQQLQQHMQASITVSHRLAMLFQQTSPVLKGILTLGMLSMDKVTPIKRSFINKIIGLSGRRPPVIIRRR